MDVRAYLDRIGYSGGLEATSDTLRGLHVAHLVTVPFENLDVRVGRAIVLDEASLFDKIVRRRRGGFCYELNGLFAELLRALGFRVTLLAAGVARESGGFGPVFDHLTLLVELEERWLSDVGFGECFLEPLPLDRRRGGEYHVARDGDWWILLRGEEAQYRFGLDAHELADFAEGCRFHSTSPESSFTQRWVVTRATPEGRITLSDTRLIVTRGGEREETAVGSWLEFADLCGMHFGLGLH